MIEYRVSKYDPIKRHDDGAFAGDEWTSVSDIGKRYRGSLLTVEEYAAAETAYVTSLRLLMGAARVASLRFVDFEQRTNFDKATVSIAGNDVSSVLSLGHRSVISSTALDQVVRASLREIIWCRLVGKGGFFVHFGYDYYMYVGMPKIAPMPTLPEGIFVERCPSPYVRSS